jgi:uncharacterized protein (TIGR03905 family)
MVTILARQEDISIFMKKYVVVFIALTSFCLFSCNNSESVTNELIKKEMITKDITYIPEGVCSQQMDISVVNDTIRSVAITKGCAGNTQGVARLVEGMHIDTAIAKLEGILCKEKATSCPDQLARALKSMK